MNESKLILDQEVYINLLIRSLLAPVEIVKVHRHVGFELALVRSHDTVKEIIRAFYPYDMQPVKCRQDHIGVQLIEPLGPCHFSQAQLKPTQLAGRKGASEPGSDDKAREGFKKIITKPAVNLVVQMSNDGRMGRPVDVCSRPKASSHLRF